MSLEFQVLSPGDRDLISQFSETRLRQVMSDETERRLKLWSVRWRGEALTHYLPLGWSFACRHGTELAGYFLAQPLLFFRGLTQTLWVEHLEADTSEARHALIDVAVRVAREKHLQGVLFSETPQADLEPWTPSVIENTIYFVKTTKGSLP